MDLHRNITLGPKWRAAVCMAAAISILGLLISEERINKRAVEQYNRDHPGDHMHYDGSWTDGVVFYLALLILVLQVIELRKRMRPGERG